MRYLSIIFGILVAVTICQSASAQQRVDDCGIIYAGVEGGCVLIGLDHYGSWLVAGDLGPYGIGDRVRVSGMLDPGCYSTCMEGNGCILIETIGPCESYICGDADGNSSIGIGDAVFIVDYVFRSGPSSVPVCAGDANGDGHVNIGDAVHIVRYIFSNGPPPEQDCCP